MRSDVGSQLERLVVIMARLRAPGGCPWDREQDLRSLRPYLVEEAFEVLDEMDRVAYGGKWRPFAEELGDLLFQIVFHAQLASELGEFGMADVCAAIADKIESRHPHVFGDAAKAETSEAVLNDWARLKAEEKKKKTGSEGSVLDGVPTFAPALLRAERLAEKASRIGFGWPDLAGVRGKLEEELREMDEAIASGRRDEIEHELGDVLFSLANVARFVKVPGEDALRQANARFVSRFQEIERGLKEQGIAFGGATLEQMEALWQRAKEKAKRGELPSPRVSSTAAVTEVALTAEGDFAALATFYDGFVAQVGWQLRRADGALRLSDGQVVFVLRPGLATTAGITLRVALPSPAALSHLGGLLGATLVSDRELQFRDPAGLIWQLTA